MMGIPVEVIEEYKSYLFDKKAGLSAEEQEKAKELGEKRKAFLKATAKTLGLSAKKLEKDIGKLIKKEKPKPKDSESSKKPKAKGKPKAEHTAEEEEQEEPEVEASSTTLKRELKPPNENTGRGGYYVNSPDLLQAHLKATGGNWQTRFPVGLY